MPPEFEPIDNTKEETTSKEGVTSGGEIPDYKALFSKTHQDLEVTKAEAENIKKEFSNFKQDVQKTQEVISKMKEVFAGGEGTQNSDPIAQEISALEEEIQDYVDAAIRADKAGKPINMTVKIGIARAKDRIEFLKEKQAWAKEKEELKKDLKRVSDPNQRALDAMFIQTDDLIEQSLKTIYPNEDSDVREAQFAAIQKLVDKEFKNLHDNFPDDWRRLQRDKNALKKLVTFCVEKSIPPKARELLKEDKIRRTPLSGDELYAAYKEAKELAVKDPKNPAHKRTVAELKSQLINKMVWERNAGKGSRSRLRDMD